MVKKRLYVWMMWIPSTYSLPANTPLTLSMSGTGDDGSTIDARVLVAIPARDTAIPFVELIELVHAQLLERDGVYAYRTGVAAPTAGHAWVCATEIQDVLGSSQLICLPSASLNVQLGLHIRPQSLNDALTDAESDLLATQIELGDALVSMRDSDAAVARVEKERDYYRGLTLATTAGAALGLFVRAAGSANPGRRADSGPSLVGGNPPVVTIERSGDKVPSAVEGNQR